MIIEHNSRESFYRSPFGAIEQGKEITLRLSIRDGAIPKNVKLILMGNNGINYQENSQESAVKNPTTSSESPRYLSVGLSTLTREAVFAHMPYIYTISSASIYECKITAPDTPCLVNYYFEIDYDDNIIYYGNNSKNYGGIGEEYDKPPLDNLYQITVYKKGYHTPDWFKESVAYQIFPDRFYNPTGTFLSARSDIIKREWGEAPYYKKEQFGGEYLSNDFFGGTLDGIRQKLPYLKELGISVIYLNPIFKAFSNHRYDTGDYELIDESLGSEDDFKRLCTEAEGQGIRIILDGVFNHTGSDSKYFNKKDKYNTIGAYQSKDSPYYSWYNFNKYPDKYESWWGVDTLPQVNELSKSYQDYILKNNNSIIKRWLRSGASGWRLDVADELPDEFIKTLKRESKKAKCDSVIIGEVWEDASNKIAYDKLRQYFYGDELDGVMNYPLKNALIAFIRQQISPSELLDIIMSLKENYPRENFYSLLNILSGHDIERVATLLGEASDNLTKDQKASFCLNTEQRDLSLRRLEVITALLMTLPGVPCIFYGDEIFTEGYGDPFCRTCFNWNKTKDNPVLEFFKYIIKVRSSSKAFSIGDFIPVYSYNNMVAYLRIFGDERYIVIANADFGADNIRIDIGKYNPDTIIDIYSKEEISSQNGVYLVGIGEIGYRIFKF